MKALVVKSEFAGYERGTTITDPQMVAAILSGEHAQVVTVTELDAAPIEITPAAEPAKKKSK